jgi:hypothetical protein
MSDFILLTDSDDPSVTAAVALLESWSVRQVQAAQLAESFGDSGVRAVLLVTTDPTLLRTATERAHASAVPVVIGCVDDVARRRAVELRAEEWYRIPASPDEISARIHSAVGRGVSLGAAVSDRVERVEYEEMLHDAMTGLPTLPVMIERSRSIFK